MLSVQRHVRFLVIVEVGGELGINLTTDPDGLYSDLVEGSARV